MSSSVWGLGWGLVQMRMGKLLKRLVATPMRRVGPARLLHPQPAAAGPARDWLLPRSSPGSSSTVRVAGSLLAFVLVAAAGALSFGGLGLLVASRAQNSETAGGLMNLVTLPMTVLSGVFFAASHFPAWMQPLVRVLPAHRRHRRAAGDLHRRRVALSARAGRSSSSLVWGAVAFVLALRIFRWS